MKNLLIILLLLSNSMLHAQLNDDFTDGNFTTNPFWNGSNGGRDFIISNNKLRSNSITTNNSFFISTENKLATNVQWDFLINLQLNTSSLNYVDVYVLSDKADLKSALINGYFIRIGNTDDEISLYKRSGTAASRVKIIDGVNGSVGSSNSTVKIRLTRDNVGRFTLEREVVTSNSSYFTEGTATDLAYTTTTHFGIFIQQSTASFVFKHFFDNITIVPILTDTVSPTLSSVSSIDSNLLEITFSEAMDSLNTKNASNYIINNNAGPVSNVLTTANPAKFHLKLINSLNSGTYTVSAVNIRDKNGNPINPNSKGSFTYIKPYIAKFGDVVINEIFPDPSPQIDLPSVEFAELRNNTSRMLSLKNWKFADPGNSATLGEISIEPNSFLIICAKADTAEYKSFGRVLGLSPWPSLNNPGELIKLASPENLLIDSVRYSDTWYRSSVKKQGGWTLERKDPASKCEGPFNWFASLDTTGGTPGKENSIHGTGYDLMPLHVDSLKQASDTTIKIYFNKNLNSSTVVPENFMLNPNTSSIKNITSESDFTEVIIAFDQKLHPDTEYQLTISNLKDCSGILVINLPDKLKFKTSKPVPVIERADTARIVITEIFADPSPEIHLPLAEFIEIYNPSKDTVNLDKWTINDPLTKTTIHGQKILPKEYVILCPAADTVHYKSYGKTIGLNPWPSLNNTSDQISLRSFKNRPVDSVNYSDTWYHNSIKKPGGWSLEKVDLNSTCANFFNWTASSDTLGGTPGKKNSGYIEGYDLLALEADSLKLTSDTTLKLYFNKYLNSATLVPENFNLLPATNTLKKITSDTEFRELIITYDKKFQPGTDYQMFVSRVKDCSGNFITNTQALAFTTRQPPPPILERIDDATIVISEIFADPSPEVGLPLAEFIEVYNPGSEAVDLNEWILSDGVTKGSITNLILAPGEYLILCPVADTLSFKQFGKTKGIAPWPALGNNNDQITLKSFKQRLVDSIAYSDRWYKNQVKKNGGWTLEKIDLLNNTCNGFYNWVSSTDSNGGTPGGFNSVGRQGGRQQHIRIDSLSYKSDSTVILYLDQVADTSHLKPSYFSVNNQIGKAVAMFIEDNYVNIHLKFGSKFQNGINYVLTADSLFNCRGEKIISPNNQASFTLPIIPEFEYPIVINEILADPSPPVGLPEIEFVELYNPTEKTVRLKGMTYGDEGLQHTFTSGEIKAKSYLILCPEKDTLSFSSYGKVLGLPVWPSLGNDKDILVLKNNKGKEIQKIAYNSTWYKDTGKRSGGYSLEMINDTSICGGSQNWLASKDLIGGTPGKENSVRNNVPAESLKLLEAVLTDSITLLLTFNKATDSLSSSLSINYTINNGLGSPGSVLPLAPDFDKVILKLKEPPVRGHTYKIEVKEVRDCSGSSITSGINSEDFILTERIVKNNVLINEILFNPRPGGVDFVEIYNNTQHVLDLKDLSIATIVKDTVSNNKPISSKQFLFKPGHYIALTSNPEIIKKEYHIENPDSILKTALPPFNDDIGTIVLLNNGVIIDQLNYTEKMHFQLLKNFNGVSLERSSFSLNTTEAGNFRSATAASGFATPGYKNSQYSLDPVGDNEFALTSKTFSPDNDGFEDVLQVSYHMPAPGMIANVKIFNGQGILVKNLLKNSTLNARGIFIWDGLNDHNAYAGAGIYVIYAEIFDTNGNLKRFRRSFALAVKL